MKSLFDYYYIHYSKMYAYLGLAYLKFAKKQNEMLNEIEAVRAIEQVQQDIKAIHESQKV